MVGKQWMWKLQHLEGRREINELHVPLGQAVKLTMTSEDVIHSFYVPAFRMKRTSAGALHRRRGSRPTKVGEYHLFCAEYCGTEHSGMIGKVIVMEPADFREWLVRASRRCRTAGTAGGRSRHRLSPVAAGEALFSRQGVRDLPSTAGRRARAVAGRRLRRAGEAAGRQRRSPPTTPTCASRSSIRPPRSWPASSRSCRPSRASSSEEQLLQLIQYIKSLKKGAPASAGRGADGRRRRPRFLKGRRMAIPAITPVAIHRPPLRPHRTI